MSACNRDNYTRFACLWRLNEEKASESAVINFEKELQSYCKSLFNYEGGL